VEPLIGESVPIPKELDALLSRPAHSMSIEPTLASLATVLG
jgi:hypothetical protein